MQTRQSDRPIDVSRTTCEVSPPQRRVWEFGGAGDTPLRVRVRVRIEGPIDTARFLDAVESTIAGYDILRTTIETAAGDPVPRQVIHDQRVRVAAHDLTSLAPRPREERLAHLEACTERRPVDGSAGLPFAVSLVTVTAQTHVLVIDAPALLCDGAAMAALVAAIWRGYHVPAADGLHTDVLQYADAAAWMNDALAAPETAVGRNVWRRFDASTVVGRRLPYARVADPDAPFTPARTSATTVSADVRARIARLPGGPTLEALLLTSWRALLRRVAADERLDVGSVTDGRDYPGLEDAVGLFACVLPLKGSTESASVCDAVLATSAALDESRLWRASFDWSLLGGLDQVDPGSRYASFVHEHRRWPDRDTRHGVTLAIETDAVIDRFDLRLVSAESEAGARWWIEYDQARYLPADVARLAGEFEVVLTDAAHHPQKALADLEILPDDERRFVVSELNPPRVETRVPCVHEQFEARAADHPGRPAVVCETETLTYAELNARANQLARHLGRLGIGPDVTVALCLERSVDLIVAVIATLKAGGAYVPLDPRLPPSRMDVMLDEARAPVLLTRSDVLSRPRTSVQTVQLDQSASAIAAESRENAGSIARAEHLAYVLFTSGSTGQPKGVAVEHRQLARYTRAVADRIEWAPHFSSATVTTLASDLGNTAIFPALCAGGCLHVVTEARAADAEALAEYVTHHAIDVLKIVPSHLRALLSVRDPGRLLPRARLVLGGEAASWDLVDTVRRLAQQCRVFNHYGPTETTVGATVFEVRGEDRPRSMTVPIGRPLAHATAYVVDGSRRPVPVWVAGELLIGGAGVARGYLNDPERTASRFVADPVASGPQARVYRTGDLVRLLPTGDLEFLGRIDDQVKIRGYRVEPAEITAALLRQPGVQDAVVLVHDQGTEKRLAAFVVPRREAGDAVLDHERLTRALERELPDYMVPTAITRVEHLPLTPNGKIDRAALLAWAPAPSSSRGGGDRSTPWEETVAGIWRELLAIDDIGSQDNFYDLGGHSLLAIQAVALLESRAGLRMPARELVFNTLSQFAALCEARQALQPSPPSV